VNTVDVESMAITQVLNVILTSLKRGKHINMNLNVMNDKTFLEETYINFCHCPTQPELNLIRVGSVKIIGWNSATQHTLLGVLRKPMKSLKESKGKE
jgi:hypothetical protein